MRLSEQAIKDLRKELEKKYNNSFQLTDDQLNEIGLFLLTQLVETLKIKSNTQ